MKTRIAIAAEDVSKYASSGVFNVSLMLPHILYESRLHANYTLIIYQLNRGYTFVIYPLRVLGSHQRPWNRNTDRMRIRSI